MRKGKIHLSVLCSCCRASFCPQITVISAGVFETRVSGFPLSMRFVLDFFIAVLNAVLEELV